MRARESYSFCVDSDWSCGCKAEPAELARRLLADPRVADRPALTPAGTIAEIASVLEARQALYHEAADVEVDTLGRTPEEIAERDPGGFVEFLSIPLGPWKDRSSC